MVFSAALDIYSVRLLSYDCVIIVAPVVANFDHVYKPRPPVYKDPGFVSFRQTLSREAPGPGARKYICGAQRRPTTLDSLH
jgi:hypothetical protein